MRHPLVLGQPLAAPLSRLPAELPQTRSPPVLPTASDFAPAALLSASASIGPMLPVVAQLSVSALLLLVIGLPHGASDHRTSGHALQNTRTTASVGGSGDVGVGGAIADLYRFYAVTVAAATALLELAPEVGLLVFLVMSAHHWGQSHGVLPSARRSFLGATIIATIVLTHASDSLSFLQLLDSVNAMRMMHGVQVYGTLGAIGFASASAWDAMQLPGSAATTAAVKEWLLLGSVWLLCEHNSLIWSFASYFCLGHSWEAWVEQLGAPAAQAMSVRRYYLDAFGFTLLLLLGLAGTAAAVLNGWVPAARGAALLLAATVPHMLLHDWLTPMASDAEKTDQSGLEG